MLGYMMERLKAQDIIMQALVRSLCGNLPTDKNCKPDAKQYPQSTSNVNLSASDEELG